MIRKFHAGIAPESLRKVAKKSRKLIAAGAIWTHKPMYHSTQLRIPMHIWKPVMDLVYLPSSVQVRYLEVPEKKTW